jgi:cell division septation protein DedD
MDTELSPAKAVTTARAISVALVSGLCLGAAALSGCEQQVQTAQKTVLGHAQPYADNFFSYVKSIDVDGTGSAASEMPQDEWQKGTKLLMDAGHDMAATQADLISFKSPFEIKLISADEARQAKADERRPPLDLRTDSETVSASAPVTPVPASRDEAGNGRTPPAPVSLDVLLKAPSSQTPPPLMKASLTTASVPLMKPALNRPRNAAPQASGGRLIQIGAFSSREAAQGAMKQLIARHPKLAAFKSSLETVITPQGQRVRLKLGPIADEAQAQALCRTLSVTDTWCVRAG